MRKENETNYQALFSQRSMFLRICTNILPSSMRGFSVLVHAFNSVFPSFSYHKTKRYLIPSLSNQGKKWCLYLSAQVDHYPPLPVSACCMGVSNPVYSPFANLTFRSSHANHIISQIVLLFNVIKLNSEQLSAASI